jgi:hypothetical protein
VVQRLQGHLVPEGREQLLGLGHVAGELGVAGGQGGDDGALAGLEAPLGVLLEHGPDRTHLGATAGALQGRPGVEHARVLAGHAPDPPVDGAGHDGHPGAGAVAPQPDPLGVDLGAGAQVGDAGPHVLDLPFGQPPAARLPFAGPDGPVVDGQHHEAGPDQVLGMGGQRLLDHGHAVPHDHGRGRVVDAVREVEVAGAADPAAAEHDLLDVHRTPPMEKERSGL